MALEEPESPSHRKRSEYITVACQTASVMLVIVGVVAILHSPAWARAGTMTLALALLMNLAGQAASFQIQMYRFVGRKHRGSTRYERLKRWNHLKTSSALHSLLVGLGVLVLLIGLLGRIGIIGLNLSGYQVDRALASFVALFVVNATYAHHQSLYIHLDADRTAGTRVLFWTGLQGALLLGAFATYINHYQVQLDLGGLSLQPSDALMLLVASFTFAGVMLGIGRGLPTLFSIMSDPRTVSHGGYVSRTKAVAMPTILAFTLLLGFILLIFVFGAGIFSILHQVGQSRAIMAVLGLMVSAVLVGIIISVYLARQEDKVVLYRETKSKEEKIRTAIVSVSLSVAAILLVGALLANLRGGMGSLEGSAWIHLASWGLLVALGPYGFYAARRLRRINQMEARFPDLLRDLASSHKGGLTLVQSVQVAARGEYGALTPEIQRLADQLTWNVPFDDAFRRFSDRVHTPLVQRSVNLVLEAGRSGGNTSDVLLAAARDAREIKSLERERSMNMSVYTTVIYVTFLVFLFVIGVLVAQFLPEITAASQAAAQSHLDASQSGLALDGIDETSYRQFYFIAGMVQAIGNGMLAGIMGSGNSTLGLRHAFVMVLLTYLAFGFIL